MNNIQLNNGVLIPQLGFGTWQAPADVAGAAVESAIKTGYTHIDTAAAYNNEEAVGEGVRRSGIARRDLFITTKVWNTERGYDKTCRAFDASLKRLGMDYVDLYLIHWPAHPFMFDNWKELNAETWRAMEQFVAEGRARAIGVSNFMPRHLLPLLDKATIVPAINQIEYHPGWMQQDCVEFCKEHGIAVEAWSPLANGDAFKMPLMQELAEKYQRSIPQIILQWAIAAGIIPLSKSVTPERIQANFKCTDFTLSAEDTARIDALEPCGGKCRNPDLVKY